VLARLDGLEQEELMADQKGKGENKDFRRSAFCIIVIREKR
jgi:hypothetical protein